MFCALFGDSRLDTVNSVIIFTLFLVFYSRHSFIRNILLLKSLRYTVSGVVWEEEKNWQPFSNKVVLELAEFCCHEPLLPNSNLHKPWKQLHHCFIVYQKVATAQVCTGV